MAYTPTNWQNLPSESTPILATSLNNIENGISGLYAMLFDELSEFSSSTTYNIGDYTIYQNTLYKCTTSHSGAWNSTHFTEKKVIEA